MLNPQEPLLRVQGVRKAFRREVAVEEVSFCVNKGEIVAIIGPSGSGKSTLLRLISQLEACDQGEIVFAGVPLQHVSRFKRRQVLQKMGMIFQEYALFDHLNVTQNLLLSPRRVYHQSPAQLATLENDLLQRMGLLEKRKAYPSELSGGQKQRVAIARALACAPSLLLMDEPTSALDGETIQQLVVLLKDLQQRGMTMVIVTHDVMFAKNVANRLLFMEQSRMIKEERLDSL